jgi:hypothetical protein
MKQITVAEVLQAVHTLLPIDKSSEKPKAPPKIKGKAS